MDRDALLFGLLSRLNQLHALLLQSRQFPPFIRDVDLNRLRCRKGFGSIASVFLHRTVGKNVSASRFDGTPVSPARDGETAIDITLRNFDAIIEFS